MLGSCVSACIRDTVFGIGGMNHFMLPANKGDGSSSGGYMGESTRYGNFAMEQMINDILKMVVCVKILKLNCLVVAGF